MDRDKHSLGRSGALVGGQATAASANSGHGAMVAHQERRLCQWTQELTGDNSFCVFSKVLLGTALVKNEKKKQPRCRPICLKSENEQLVGGNACASPLSGLKALRPGVFICRFVNLSYLSPTLQPWVLRPPKARCLDDQLRLHTPHLRVYKEPPPPVTAGIKRLVYQVRAGF